MGRFQEGRFHLLPTHPFVFVCGASHSDSNSLRTKFIAHATSRLNKINFFQAEGAYSHLGSDGELKFKNLATFEKTLAELADCVVIFPESPGSFAEVGYFSAKNTIRKSVMLVVDDRYQGDSFLTVGPYDLIDSKSAFSSRIVVNRDSPEIGFSAIEDRLKRIKTRSVRKTVSPGKFQNFSRLIQLSIIAFFVELFQPVSFADLDFTLFSVLGKGTYRPTLDELLAVLIDGNFVEFVHEDESLRYTGARQRLMDIDGFDRDEFRIQLFES